MFSFRSYLSFLIFRALIIYILFIISIVSCTSYFTLGQENGPKTYNFSYDTKNNDKTSNGPRLMREESRLPDGTVLGRYGYTDPFGVFRQVEYVAGPDGYYAYEDVGGRSSSIPLFFKATARQKELSHENPFFSSFNPPLYHPEAHEAASDWQPEYKEINDKKTAKINNKATDIFEGLESSSIRKENNDFPVISLSPDGLQLDDIVKLLPEQSENNQENNYQSVKSSISISSSSYSPSLPSLSSSTSSFSSSSSTSTSSSSSSLPSSTSNLTSNSTSASTSKSTSILSTIKYALSSVSSISSNDIKKKTWRTNVLSPFGFPTYINKLLSVLPSNNSSSNKSNSSQQLISSSKSVFDKINNTTTLYGKRLSSNNKSLIDSYLKEFNVFKSETENHYSRPFKTGMIESQILSNNNNNNNKRKVLNSTLNSSPSSSSLNSSKLRSPSSGIFKLAGIKINTSKPSVISYNSYNQNLEVNQSNNYKKNPWTERINLTSWSISSNRGNEDKLTTPNSPTTITISTITEKKNNTTVSPTTYIYTKDFVLDHDQQNEASFSILSQLFYRPYKTNTNTKETNSKLSPSSLSSTTTTINSKTRLDQLRTSSTTPFTLLLNSSELSDTMKYRRRQVNKPSNLDKIKLTTELSTPSDYPVYILNSEEKSKSDSENYKSTEYSSPYKKLMITADPDSVLVSTTAIINKELLNTVTSTITTSETTTLPTINIEGKTLNSLAPTTLISSSPSPFLSTSVSSEHQKKSVQNNNRSQLMENISPRIFPYTSNIEYQDKYKLLKPMNLSNDQDNKEKNKTIQIQKIYNPIQKSSSSPLSSDKSSQSLVFPSSDTSHVLRSSGLEMIKMNTKQGNNDSSQVFNEITNISLTPSLNKSSSSSSLSILPPSHPPTLSSSASTLSFFNGNKLSNPDNFDNLQNIKRKIVKIVAYKGNLANNLTNNVTMRINRNSGNIKRKKIVFLKRYINHTSRIFNGIHNHMIKDNNNNSEIILTTNPEFSNRKSSNLTYIKPDKSTSSTITRLDQTVSTNILSTQSQEEKLLLKKKNISSTTLKPSNMKFLNSSLPTHGITNINNTTTIYNTNVSDTNTTIITTNVTPKISVENKTFASKEMENKEKNNNENNEKIVQISSVKKITSSISPSLPIKSDTGKNADTSFISKIVNYMPPIPVKNNILPRFDIFQSLLYQHIGSFSNKDNRRHPFSQYTLPLPYKIV